MIKKYVPDNFIFPLRFASASVCEIPTVMVKTKAIVTKKHTSRPLISNICIYLAIIWLLSAAEGFQSLLLFGPSSWFHLNFENCSPSKNNAAREKMAGQHYMNEAGTPKSLSVVVKSLSWKWWRSSWFKQSETYRKFENKWAFSFLSWRLFLFFGRGDFATSTARASHESEFEKTEVNLKQKKKRFYSKKWKDIQWKLG